MTSPGQVLRVVGTTAFLAYGGGSIIQAIWMGKPWVSTAKEILDRLRAAIRISSVPVARVGSPTAYPLA